MLTEALLLEAKNFGFLASGVIDIELAFQSGAFQTHLEKYDEWLSRGYSGEMEYLVRGRDRRADPRLVFAEAKSIFQVLDPYNPSPAGSQKTSEGPRYARYLRGPDYHETLNAKLTELMKRVTNTPGLEKVKYKICVDTSALLERSWAALAGLGWIGKNTLLIHPKFGSYTFIGSILLDQTTGVGPLPMADLCGHCDRCLRACPTEAILDPHLLDSNKCISYLTLEKRGTWNISDELESKIGPWVAGCDLCQEVCPFNQKISKGAVEPLEQGAVSKDKWSSLLEESEDEYKIRVKGSSLARVKPIDFRRNLERAHRNSVSQKISSHKLQPVLGLPVETLK